jgi:hypothetical protein
MMQLVKGAQETASARAAAYGVRLPEAIDPWFVKATATEASLRHESSSAMIAELGQLFGLAAPAGSLTPLPRSPLPAAPVSPSLASARPAVQDSSVLGQTTQNDSASGMVRSDEPSLQPVSISKLTRAWVVPVSLLVVGVVGIASAFLLWPDENASAVQGSSESVRMPVEMAPTVAPAAPRVAASSETIDVAPVASAIVSASVSSSDSTAKIAASAAPAAPTATNALPQTPSTAASKPIRPKGNDVLDQY